MSERVAMTFPLHFQWRKWIRIVASVADDSMQPDTQCANTRLDVHSAKSRN
jgi:hypothetical protein